MSSESSGNDNQAPDPSKIVALLRKLDEKGSDQFDADLHGISQLSDADIEMLGQAKDAIAYLGQVRELCEKESVPLKRDSTLGEHTNPVERPATNQSLPERIDRFSIIRLLGQGGFGSVFLAHDPKLARDVALKVPHPKTLISNDAQLRFQIEARATAILGHPGIVPVFECGNA